MDFLELWKNGGYGKDNELSVSIERIKRHGKEKKVPDEVVDSIIVDFFTQIQVDPKKYMKPFIEYEVFDKESNKLIKVKTRECLCGCIIGNSGTNFIHSVFKEIEKASIEQAKEKSKVIAKSFDKRIKAYEKLKGRRTLTPQLITILLILITFYLARFYYGFNG